MKLMHHETNMNDYDPLHRTNKVIIKEQFTVCRQSCSQPQEGKQRNSQSLD